MNKKNVKTKPTDTTCACDASRILLEIKQVLATDNLLEYVRERDDKNKSNNR
jgi:hypothetical protein